MKILPRAISVWGTPLSPKAFVCLALGILCVSLSPVIAPAHTSKRVLVLCPDRPDFPSYQWQWGGAETVIKAWSQLLADGMYAYTSDAKKP